MVLFGEDIAILPILEWKAVGCVAARGWKGSVPAAFC